jgi:hypothetical protein
MDRYSELLSFDALPKNVEDRHEAVLNYFGDQLCQSFEMACRATMSKMNKPATVRPVDRAPYEVASRLSPEQKQAVMEISKDCTNMLINFLLPLLGSAGYQNRLGDKHYVRYRLDAEICKTPSDEDDSEESDDPIEVQTINRTGIRYFGEMWPVWKNKYLSPNIP